MSFSSVRDIDTIVVDTRMRIISGVIDVEVERVVGPHEQCVITDVLDASPLAAKELMEENTAFAETELWTHNPRQPSVRKAIRSFYFVVHIDQLEVAAARRGEVKCVAVAVLERSVERSRHHCRHRGYAGFHVLATVVAKLHNGEHFPVVHSGVHEAAVTQILT
jgi:hypothetical protein